MAARLSTERDQLLWFPPHDYRIRLLHLGFRPWLAASTPGLRRNRELQKRLVFLDESDQDLHAGVFGQGQLFVLGQVLDPQRDLG